ncbi:hypothetical protein C8P68_102894 [Mucilaginibacter yixingensis]|uniref:Uncharacterized protein n=1 Tax=Mucilaginibacter yixingensis TaxID=1295612 RepID=A0A2T5JE70_9SPHI|nr:hypothetical protein [Mucilaginibacter yixingensis]PTR00063.1 hypothetical protein C8P68_102894 [Mucilaginibacter yixingensis]
MPNIKLSYFYRDSANYKVFNNVIFFNDQGLDLVSVEDIIKSKLIDQTWFYPGEWHLPDLFSGYFDPNIDPAWHEFESLDYSDEDLLCDIRLSVFLNNI